jgi:hypothetical protein
MPLTRILGEEDLALFQLVNDISENEQVLYAFITDKILSRSVHRGHQERPVTLHRQRLHTIPRSFFRQRRLFDVPQKN